MASILIAKMVIILILAIGITYLVTSSIFPSISNHASSNVSIAFAANNTYYPLNKSIYTASPYAPTLAYVNGTTDIGNYTYNSTHVMIGADETAATYYGYYTYYDRVWLAGNNYDWVLTIIIFVMAAVVLMYFLRVF